MKAGGTPFLKVCSSLGWDGFAVHIADFGQVSEKQGEVGFLILQGGEEVGDKAFVVSFVCLLQTEFAAHFL